MPHLNADERQNLANELAGMKFGRATARLRAMDRRGRLAFYRNVQYSGQIHTRYILPGSGVQVTLVESSNPTDAKRPGWFKQKYQLSSVIVEALPDNERERELYPSGGQTLPATLGENRV